MPTLGGPRNVIDAVKAAGRQAGPMSVWVTGGAIKWGTGNLDTHYAACKALGVDPLVKFWFWGDDISTRAILDGVKDQYQGTWKTRAIALDLARQIGEKAQAAGVRPIVAIEHEFAQRGLETDGSAFAPYFDDAAAAIRKACPSARIAFCCPIWEDEALIAKTYSRQIAGCDVIASQTLLFPPRHASRDFTNAGINFRDAFAKLRALAPGKPAGIVDLGFSSYGGPYESGHPFAGGTGNGNDALQAAALKGVADNATAMNLAFVVHRDLKDIAGFAISNYGGYAERHIGVVRGDGSRKPGYTELLRIASPVAAPPPPPPPAPTAADLEAARQAQAAAEAEKAKAEQERDVALQLAEGLQGRLEAVRTAGGWQ